MMGRSMPFYGDDGQNRNADHFHQKRPRAAAQALLHQATDLPGSATGDLSTS